MTRPQATPSDHAEVDDQRSVISWHNDPTSAGGPEAAAAGAAAPERPARVRKTAYPAMRTDRDEEQQRLSGHEKQQLRKLSQQLVQFRFWLTEQDPLLYCYRQGQIRVRAKSSSI